MQIRVMTFNVRSLRDDRDAVVRLLRSAEPDVVCLQEAPRRVRWRYHNARLAADAGLLYVAGGGTTAGTVLLSRLRIDVHEIVERALSRTPGLHPRGVAAALLRADRQPFAIASIHLGLDAAERARHLGEITDLMRSFGTPPTIVAGDLNETPERLVWQALTDQLRDTLPDGPPTFPVRAPRHRIDGIFVSGHWMVKHSEVLDTPDVRLASDHRPVLADLALPAR